MPHADVDGRPIRYEDTGDDAPAVLFCHGFLMDRRMFAPQVRELSPGFRCVRMDERGFGGTPVDGPFDYWDLADDAVGLLDRLGIGSAVLCGHSQGGFLALRAALRHPDRVHGLVLVDTDASVDPPETKAGYREMFDAWMSEGPSEAMLEELAGMILGSDPGLRETWIERWRALDPDRLRHPVDCLLDRDDVSDRLGEITCPALVVHGSEDASIPLERARALDEGLPGSAGLVEVPGAAHAPLLSHPEAVNPPLRSFLEEYA